MSWWTKLGLSITDLGCFKKSCEQHGIEYSENQDVNFKVQGSPVHAFLKDTKGHSQGYLVREKGGYKVVVDSDPNYSSITKRLGKNGGKLTRDYTRSVIEKGVKRNGGIVNLVKEQPDGSLIMKVSAIR